MPTIEINLLTRILKISWKRSHISQKYPQQIPTSQTRTHPKKTRYLRLNCIQKKNMFLNQWLHHKSPILRSSPRAVAPSSAPPPTAVSEVSPVRVQVLLAELRLSRLFRLELDWLREQLDRLVLGPSPPLPPVGPDNTDDVDDEDGFTPVPTTAPELWWDFRLEFIADDDAEADGLTGGWKMSTENLKAQEDIMVFLSVIFSHCFGLIVLRHLFSKFFHRLVWNRLSRSYMYPEPVN